MTPGDYLLILRRWKWWFILTASCILAAAIAATLLWPPIYRSEAIILIEDSDVPQELVSSLVPDYIEKRLESISRRVMVTDRLLPIIDRYKLYAEERQRATVNSVADRMRANISRDMIRANVFDNTGQRRSATIAFSLAFDYRDPNVAAQVTNELVSLFLNENVRMRREYVADTTEFLRSERQRSEARVGELEGRLAEFKARYADILPERLPYNQALVTSTEAELRDLDRRSQSLREQESFLSTQLAQMDPMQPMTGTVGASPLAQLEAARAELATTSARYGATHPDVERLQREVEALARTVDATGDLGRTSLDRQRALLQARLASLQERYGPDHPDVRSTQRELESVEGALRASVQASARSSLAQRPTNPAYLTLQAQLAGVRTELAATIEQRTQVAALLKDRQELLFRTPLIEKDYAEIQRNLADAQTQRDELVAKQLTAELGESLEKDAKAERLSLLEPPSLPTSPHWPNRRMFLMLGLVLATGGGLGAVTLRHLLDGHVWTAKEITALLGVAPLVVVPHVATRRERAGRWGGIVLMAALALALAAAAIWWLDRRYGPLDVLLGEMQRRTLDRVLPFLPGSLRGLLGPATLW